MSNWYRAFMAKLGVKNTPSSVYHPQTDGQTERTNRTLEEYLRAYVTPSSNDWYKLLPTAEFAYNDSFHTAIGTTPFFLNYGCHPSSPLSVQLRKTVVPHAKRYVSAMRHNMRLAKQMIHRAQQRAKAHYDKHHYDHWFQVGEQVLLSTENLKLLGCPKFWPRYVGPFTITEVISTHAYRLDLPATWKIHPIFHISLLKPFESDGSFHPLSLPDLLNEDTYAVASIHAHRSMRSGSKLKYEYLCGYNDEDEASRTWERESDLLKHCPQLLASYKRQHTL